MTELVLLNETDDIQPLDSIGNLAVIEIEKQDVERGNIASALNRLLPLSDRSDLTEYLENSVCLIFNGYNDDPKELFEISKVTEYFKILTSEWPYLLHFASVETESFSLCLSLWSSRINSSIVGSKIKSSLSIGNGVLEQQILGAANLNEFHKLQSNETYESTIKEKLALFSIEL